MTLVQYSDSETSENEEGQAVSKVAAADPKRGKPAFQKVVDRSNPRKIRVALPEISKKNDEDGGEESEPPAKKLRAGAESFTSFNSFLPAPKRSGASTNDSRIGGISRKGLGSGVSLKTGAAPAFARESTASLSGADLGATEDGIADSSQQEAQKSTISRREEPLSSDKVAPIESPNSEVKQQGNSMIFKPLSVARKPRKKPPIANGTDGGATKNEATVAQPVRKPQKATLFSAATEREEDNSRQASNTSYQPMIYNAGSDLHTTEDLLDDSNMEEELPVANTINMEPAIGPQSLDAIASDLHLSASAKRQLLGRQKNSHSAINVVNFNTDQEYAANELFRQAGEQVQHNPVRAIAPGKHSLKQLLNAASNQKDALEEQFASGRRNKKEAGSKYGW